MEDRKAAITNRQALRDYHIEKTFEAGLELYGCEVKSIRAGRANLKGSFARVDNLEVFIYNMHVDPYEYTLEELDPVRPRKLLLHKAQIRQIETKLSQKGYALVPMKIYFRGRYAKVEIGIGKGKKQYDKREDIKKKQATREIERALRHRNK